MPSTCDIERLGNVALHQLAISRRDDAAFLRRVLKVLDSRRRMTADPARAFICEQLAIFEAKSQRSTARSFTWKAFAATAAGVVLVGVGQAVGGDIWKVLSPRLAEIWLTLNG